MINKLWITLPVVYSRPFDSKRFFERFWMNLSSPLTVFYNRRIREETLFWKGSSTGAILSRKMASVRFQSSQHKGQKIHDSSRTFQSEIHPNGPELALEENQNPTVFERLGCIARSILASHKPSRWLSLSDWTTLDRRPIRKNTAKIRGLLEHQFYFFVNKDTPCNQRVHFLRTGIISHITYLAYRNMT